MNAEQTIEKYSHMVTADIQDGNYSITGIRKNSAVYLRDWIASDLKVTILAVGLVGWSDYDHYLQCDAGINSFYCMAKLR